jgi:hypothetical protein
MDSEALYFARTDGLVVEGVGDQLLIYDESADVAHSLSPVASAIWSACREGASLDDLTELVGGLQPEVDAEGLALTALAELLDKALLLDRGDAMSRRDALRRIAFTASAALVATAVVPPAAAMASGGSFGIHHTCTADNQCANGLNCQSGYCYTIGQTCKAPGQNDGSCNGAGGTNDKCCSNTCSANNKCA